MLLSTSFARLETCTLVSKYDFLQKYIGKDVMRIISTNGISYSEIDKRDFETLVNIFVPADIRKTHVTGLETGEYKRGVYNLRIELSSEPTVSHKLTLTKNSPN